MRIKYKKRLSPERAEKENKIIVQSSLNDLSTLKHSKILSPQLKIKNNFILKGNNDNFYINNDIKKYNLNSQNDKYKRIHLNSKINNEINKNNNIVTASYEFKNTKLNNNVNSLENNYTKIFQSKINKDNNENIRNMKIKKEKELLMNNNVILNKNHINFRNRSQKSIYEKNNELFNNTYFKNKNDISLIEKIKINKLNKSLNKNNNEEKEININNKELNKENKIKNSSINVDKISTYNKDSLKHLIHKVHKIKELTESFNMNKIPILKNIKYKKSTFDSNVENNYSSNKNIFDNLNNNNEPEIIVNKNSMKLDIFKTETYKIGKRPKNKSLDEILKKENNIYNANIINYKKNSHLLNYKNNINNAKSLSEKKDYLKEDNNWSFLNKNPSNNFIHNNTLENNPIQNNLRTNKYSLTFINSIPGIDNFDKNQNGFFEIDLEEFYNIGNKYNIILQKLRNLQECTNECLDFITYYYNTRLFYKIIKLFKSKNNKYTLSNYIKMEILSIFLCYDLFNNNNFFRMSSSLISLFNVLHNNFIFLLIFILNNYNLNINLINNILLNNEIFLDKINQLVNNERNLQPYQNEIKKESDIINLIIDDYKEINYYYKYILDKMYIFSYNLILKDINFLNFIKYNGNNRNIFPICLQINNNKITYEQIIGLVSLFFFDPITKTNNYNFKELIVFFEKYILISDDINIYDYYKNNNVINNKERYINAINNNDNQLKYRDFSLSINKNHNQFFLPPIKNGYKYTLVLDLDETLIYCRKENKNNIKIYNNLNDNLLINKKTLIFRPGLFEFLHKMKRIYELVLFSFGTCDYVNSIVNKIENKEKFFEYILYRHHATYNDNIYIKNLSLLGRDLKSIIIVDDLPQVFKLHKNNGICIKPFYGDTIGDRNTLKILGEVLQKIRFDAEESGDIRESLKKHKDYIFTYITNDLELN